MEIRMSDQPPASVAALIAQWRHVAETFRRDMVGEDSRTADLYEKGAESYEDCADALEALIGRLPVPPCPLCSIDDGLVREWVWKARDVARSKGLLDE
jgi:hypothetical protein